MCSRLLVQRAIGSVTGRYISRCSTVLHTIEQETVFSKIISKDIPADILYEDNTVL